MLNRQKHARRARRAVTASLALTLLATAAACGNGDDGPPDASATEASVAESSSAESSSAESSSAESSSAESSSAESSSAESSSAESSSASVDGWFGVDIGPANLDAVLDELGAVEPGDVTTTGCEAMPYVENEVLVYLAPRLREGEEREANEVTATSAIRDALLAVEISLADASDNVFLSDDAQAVAGAPGPVFLLRTVEPISIAAVAQANAALLDIAEFGGGVAIDVNHIAPFLPIGTFHPGSDPVWADVPSEASDDTDLVHSVLVVDTPEESSISYDEWSEVWSSDVANPVATSRGGDQKVDFVAGHGPFVVDIIERGATEPPVELSEVIPGDGWPGFLFDASDLFTSLMGSLGDDGSVPRRFTTRFDLINFSLGLFGCTDDRHPVLHLVLADILDPNNYVVELELEPDDTTYFVAAAGNDGTQREHFPAAFANDGDVVGEHTIAVGALAEDEEANGQAAACYSNWGWVSVWAPGTATAVFPKAWPDSSSGYATWSGTSFAAANVTRALAIEPGEVGDVVDQLATGTDFGAVRYDTAVTNDNPCVP